MTNLPTWKLSFVDVNLPPGEYTVLTGLRWGWWSQGAATYQISGWVELFGMPPWCHSWCRMPRWMHLLVKAVLSRPGVVCVHVSLNVSVTGHMKRHPETICAGCWHVGSGWVFSALLTLLHVSLRVCCWYMSLCTFPPQRLKPIEKSYPDCGPRVYPAMSFWMMFLEVKKLAVPWGLVNPILELGVAASDPFPNFHSGWFQ